MLAERVHNAGSGQPHHVLKKAHEANPDNLSEPNLPRFGRHQHHFDHAVRFLLNDARMHWRSQCGLQRRRQVADPGCRNFCLDQRFHA